MITYESQDATQHPGTCPDCGMIEVQAYHRCYARQWFSVSSNSATVRTASKSEATQQVRSRRDVERKRKELRGKGR